MQSMESNQADSLLYKEEVYKVIGAAMEVHKELGPGFLEPVYQEALELELQERGVPFQPQQRIKINYKNALLTKEYIADFVCYQQILVEIKSMECLTDREEAQVLNYLKATGFPVGLLINFGSFGRLEWRRFANTRRTSSSTR